MSDHKERPEFSSEHQPARRGRTPKRAQYAGQFKEFDDRAAGMFTQALDTYQAILDGTFRQPMMNNKTGVVEDVGPTADQSLKAADAITNRVMGKAASHKEVEVNIERQDTMTILTGDAAAELRSLRRRNKELEARLNEGPKAIEAGFREEDERGQLPSGLADSVAAAFDGPLSTLSPSPVPVPALAVSPSSPVSAAAAYLPPTDVSSAAFSSVPASERKVEQSRVKAEEG